MPPKGRQIAPPSNFAPRRGFFSTVYNEIKSPENASVVRSVTVFAVCALIVLACLLVNSDRSSDCYCFLCIIVCGVPAVSVICPPNLLSLRSMSYTDGYVGSKHTHITLVQHPLYMCAVSDCSWRWVALGGANMMLQTQISSCS